MKTTIFSLIIGASMAVSAEAGDHHRQSEAQARSAPAARNGGARSAGFASRGSYRYNSTRFAGSSQRFSGLSARRSTLGPYSIRSGYVDSFNNQRRVSGLNNRSITRQGNNFSTLRNNGRVEGLHRSGGPDARPHNGRVDGLHNGRGNFGNGSNRIVARHPESWHRDWDHHHDHWWHGHRCHFIGGSWVVFGLGYPWGYPYDYYPYDYYYGSPYGYEYGPPVYDSVPDNGYDQDDGAYDSSGGYDPKDSPTTTGSAISSAQDSLSRLGYYHGQVDGVMGQDTYRAIMRYQSDKGLAPTGKLNAETLNSLGIRY